MRTSSTVVSRVVVVLLCAAAFWPQTSTAQSTLERIAVVGSEHGLGVQISASGPVTTEAQVLSGPDRLVIDFPGAVPGRELRGLRLNQGEIRAVRAGLWRSDPPVTRIVIDLSGPMPYRLIPSGKAITVRLGAEPTTAVADNFPGVTIERHPTARALEALSRPSEPPLRVGFDRGLLTISARKATLADVLYQVHLRTGADIPIPSGAEQEQVAIQAGPGPAKDVIAALLNGSRFNYVLQGTTQDPQGVGAVILTPKSNISEQPYTPPPAAAAPPEPVAAYPEPVTPARGRAGPPVMPPNAPLQDENMPDAQINPGAPGNIQPPANPEDPQE